MVQTMAYYFLQAKAIIKIPWRNINWCLKFLERFSDKEKSWFRCHAKMWVKMCLLRDNFYGFNSDPSDINPK